MRICGHSMHSLALAHSIGREVFFGTAKPHQKTDCTFFGSCEPNSAKLGLISAKLFVQRDKKTCNIRPFRVK